VAPPACESDNFSSRSAVGTHHKQSHTYKTG
jgi:hypothetical protein